MKIAPLFTFIGTTAIILACGTAEAITPTVHPEQESPGISEGEQTTQLSITQNLVENRPSDPHTGIQLNINIAGADPNKLNIGFLRIWDGRGNNFLVIQNNVNVEQWDEGNPANLCPQNIFDDANDYIPESMKNMSAQALSACLDQAAESKIMNYDVYGNQTVIAPLPIIRGTDQYFFQLDRNDPTYIDFAGQKVSVESFKDALIDRYIAKGFTKNNIVITEGMTPIDSWLVSRFTPEPTPTPQPTLEPTIPPTMSTIQQAETRLSYNAIQSEWQPTPTTLTISLGITSPLEVYQIDRPGTSAAILFALSDRSDSNQGTMIKAIKNLQKDGNDWLHDIKRDIYDKVGDKKYSLVKHVPESTRIRFTPEMQQTLTITDAEIIYGHGVIYIVGHVTNSPDDFSVIEIDNRYASDNMEITVTDNAGAVALGANKTLNNTIDWRHHPVWNDNGENPDNGGIIVIPGDRAIAVSQMMSGMTESEIQQMSTDLQNAQTFITDAYIIDQAGQRIPVQLPIGTRSFANGQSSINELIASTINGQRYIRTTVNVAQMQSTLNGRPESKDLFSTQLIAAYGATPPALVEVFIPLAEVASREYDYKGDKVDSITITPTPIATPTYSPSSYLGSPFVLNAVSAQIPILSPHELHNKRRQAQREWRQRNATMAS